MLEQNESDESRILLAFDDESSIYPFVIVPTTPVSQVHYGPMEGIETFSGLHFADTASLLSITDEDVEYKTFHLDKNYNTIDIENEAISYKKTAFIIETVEIGTWCKALVAGGPSVLFESIFHPFVYRNSDFIIFEEIAREMVTKDTCYHDLALATATYEELISPKPCSSMQNIVCAFDGYYNSLRGIELARLKEFSFELESSVFSSEKDNIKMYQEVLKKLESSNNFSTLSRFEISSIYFELVGLTIILEESIKESELPKEPSEENIKKLTNELLRLRRALF